MRHEVYDSLAALLIYPQAHLPALCHSERSEESAVDCQLGSFHRQVYCLSLHELQELYIRTFDLNPVCALEMGWHLFGENYDRGLLLVKMRQQLRAHGLEEDTELPDHLTNALGLLPRMERQAAVYFAEAVVLPALEKMLEAIRGKENPYEHVLEAARLVIRSDFPEIPERLAVPAEIPELRVLA
jgi:nitrate reductase molybdenum cofactor assembly chaperone